MPSAQRQRLRPHTHRVCSGEKQGSWGGKPTPLQRCHSPVMGTSGRGCSFLQDGTNTVMSVWPRSRNQFTASRMPRQEKTSLFPWLWGRGGGSGGRGSHSSPCPGSQPTPFRPGPTPAFPAGSHSAQDDQTWDFP